MANVSLVHLHMDEILFVYLVIREDIVQFF